MHNQAPQTEQLAMKKLLWFIGSFAGMLVVCVTGWWLVAAKTAAPRVAEAEVTYTSLLNLELPTTDVTNAKTGEPVSLTEASVSDAVVILLGGIGCSLDQVEVLRWWQENRAAADTGRQEIIALYADPLIGVEGSRYETLVLRRAGEVQFPTLVYEGQEFNPRSMGVRTPQVVRVRDGRIVEVLPRKFPVEGS